MLSKEGKQNEKVYIRKRQQHNQPFIYLWIVCSEVMSYAKCHIKVCIIPSMYPRMQNVQSETASCAYKQTVSRKSEGTIFELDNLFWFSDVYFPSGFREWFPLMPRKAIKTEKPPLLFLERSLCGARLQNVPEVRAAFNAKEFFTEKQEHNSSALKSWVSCSLSLNAPWVAWLCGCKQWRPLLKCAEARHLCCRRKGL